MIKLISIKKSTKPDKKYEAIFNIDGKQKKTNFGLKNASDYTIHKDIERRNRYINRHKKDLETNDPTRAGYLSMGIIWSKPNLKDSVNFYKKLLKEYNETGDIGKFKKSLINP